MPTTIRGASAERARDAATVTGVASILLSLLAVILCGGVGALAAFALISALGLGGVIGAIVALIVAVIVGTLLFALGIMVLRSLRWLK